MQIEDYYRNNPNAIRRDGPDSNRNTFKLLREKEDMTNAEYTTSKLDISNNSVAPMDLDIEELSKSMQQSGGG